MDFIQPLEMESWIFTIFVGGTPEIFTALAVLIIAIISGYFKMPLLVMFLMIVTFLLMFANWVSSPILLLIAIFGGLAFGYTISKIFGN